MPIDPSIPLGVRPIEINPFGQLMQMEQVRATRESSKALAEQRRAITAETQQKATDRTSLDTAAAAGGTVEDIIARLPGHLQPKAREDYAKADQAAAVAAKARTDAAIIDADFKGQFAAQWKAYQFDPDAGRILLEVAKKHGHDFSDVEAQLARGAKPEQIADALINASPKQRELRNTETVTTETGRHNLATEGVAGQAQMETARHNTALEAANEQVRKLTESGQRETARHNRATEGIQRAAATAEASQVLDLTPEALDVVAHQFAMTGQLPPMGNSAKAGPVRTKIINRAAELYKGLDVVSQRAAFDANKRSLVTMTGQRDAVLSFEATAVKNLDVFLDLAKQIPDTGSPALNQPLRYANEKMFGGATLTAYNAARRTVIPEFAKILSNPSLTGVLSDSARHEVEEVLSGNATLAQTIAVAKVLKTDTHNRRTALDDSIKAITGRIATPPGAAPGPAAGDVDMVAPDGRALKVPAAKVQEMIGLGAKLK